MVNTKSYLGIIEYTRDSTQQRNDFAMQLFLIGIGGGNDGRGRGGGSGKMHGRVEEVEERVDELPREVDTVGGHLELEDRAEGSDGLVVEGGRGVVQHEVPEGVDDLVQLGGVAGRQLGNAPERGLVQQVTGELVVGRAWHGRNRGR